MSTITVTQVTNAIMRMKLDLPSSDIVEVKMEHLELLLSEIYRLTKIVNNSSIMLTTLQNKVDLLNSLAKKSLYKKALESYL